MEKGLTERGCLTVDWPKEIAATNGTEKLSYAYDVFNRIDELFSLLGGHENSIPTERTEISIYLAGRAHTFATVFECITKDLDNACVTLNQVKEFARANMQWIVDGERLIYFLVKHGDAYYVVSVTTDHLSRRYLQALMFRYHDEMVWPGRMAQIFVIPKQ